MGRTLSSRDQEARGAAEEESGASRQQLASSLRILEDVVVLRVYDGRFGGIWLRWSVDLILVCVECAEGSP
ncbi:hypothetical protein L6452_22615 [Arctium lappa]|uniref:Uncharacterized protein n=1 Tax=Arctium lappa TaxID=4217 RepID=A0ACB9B174_ARCLA|nr:hypothetical protein L6452_22615 [Arctium lappa]